VDESLIDGSEFARQQFPLRVPRGFVERMEKGDPNDPLLLQVLPIAKELQSHPDFVTDPLGEKAVNPIPGLLHKYHGRVLLTLTSACAINCRYCFRRHFPYQDNKPGRKNLEKALEYIAADESITEVILSGGDPLVADDAYLADLVAALEKISHVKRLRIHTRLPIVLPERITESLLSLLSKTRLQAVLVTHCNHPNEIDPAVEHAMGLLKHHGISLFNQAVLLRGVNASVDVLSRLSERLFDIGVIPYYLHVLDKVDGAAHFDVDEVRAKELIKGVMGRLPGYMVPCLVREVAGAESKVRI